MPLTIDRQDESLATPAQDAASAPVSSCVLYQIQLPSSFQTSNLRERAPWALDCVPSLNRPRHAVSASAVAQAAAWATDGVIPSPQLEPPVLRDGVYQVQHVTDSGEQVTLFRVTREGIATPESRMLAQARLQSIVDAACAGRIEDPGSQVRSIRLLWHVMNRVAERCGCIPSQHAHYWPANGYSYRLGRSATQYWLIRPDFNASTVSNIRDDIALLGGLIIAEIPMAIRPGDATDRMVAEVIQQWHSALHRHYTARRPYTSSSRRKETWMAQFAEGMRPFGSAMLLAAMRETDFHFASQAVAAHDTARASYGSLRAELGLRPATCPF